MTSLTIPSSVTSIDESAFSGCSGLTSITVESGNTVYDSRDNCNAIIKTGTNTLVIGCAKTIIPNSVTSIGRSAFSGCRGLTSLSIPSSVTSIGECAFFGCSGLTSLSIPSSVTSIGERAFFGCSGLRTIHCLNTTPPRPTGYHVFDSTTYSLGILFVPQGSIDAYKSEREWDSFHFIVEE